MTHRTWIAGALAALTSVVLLTACGSSDSSDAAPTATTAALATTPPASSTTAAPSAAAPSTTAPTSVAAPNGAAPAIVNTWSGPPVDLTRLPIGTSRVSTTAPAKGGLFSCSAGNPNAGGAFRTGPWIDEAAGTWDLTAKLSVQGSVAWPMARYAENVEGDQRTIASNGVPVAAVTGTFPIAATDPAFAYDRNPNTISERDITVSLPARPAAAATPSCLPMGPVGIMRNGVVAFASLDARGRDAAAYETQDECSGHPQDAGAYHYHDVPSCILAASTGPSTVVGFALDGFPIVVERNAAGELPTNADLDECHGRTSPIELDGAVVTTYHYSATQEFPYFIGCFRGTPVG